MNKELIEQAKKHKVSLKETSRVSLPARQWDKNSARDWIKTLQEFLDKNKLEDANITVELTGYDGYLEDIYVEAEVERSEEDVQKDIDLRIEHEKLKKQQAKDAAKKKREEDIATLKRLKKKYPNE